MSARGENQMSVDNSAEPGAVQTADDRGLVTRQAHGELIAEVQEAAGG